MTIAKIERFMVNSLLASPEIPLDVNVLRLADVQDKEGVVVFPRSITVRFTGSTTTVLQRVPLVLERSMDFLLEISCQNHQTRSGHDYATYLLGACSRALMNRVPLGTDFSIETPFTLERESFQGLTDSSHFVYEQSWSLVVKEVLPNVSQDPCVARGDCSKLFPEDTTTTVLEGEALLGNRVYHLKPSDGLDCAQYGGVKPDAEGNLVTIEDEEVVYLTSAQRDAGFTYIIKPIEDSTDVLVTVRGVDGVIIRSDLYCWTGRTVLGIFAYLTNQGQSPEKIFSLSMPYAQRVVIVDDSALAYRDPSSEEEVPVQLRYGNLVMVDTNVTLNVGEETYTKVYIPQFDGTGWLSNGTFKFLFEMWECDDEPS
jgi:hypothetical protein